MSKFSLLSRNEYKLTDKLIVHIPTLAEIRKDQNTEIEYYGFISMFTRTPCDMMVELDDMGIDYTQIKEYDLFLMIFFSFIESKQEKDEKNWNMVFPYLDLKDINISELNGKLVITNIDNEVVIDEGIYLKLADLIRDFLNLEKNMEHYKVPEVETRKYIIDRQRLKRKRELERLKRNGNKKSPSILDGVILYLVNNCNFKYDFKTINDLTIYDFWASYRQIAKVEEIDGIMSGYWAGNVDLKKIDKATLNRIIL